ncbi:MULTISPECIES: hypothetical protein [Nostocales]|uniref:VOC domain-containing protein n=3 Tax=Nostocales TaxID=1161 RepID=A0A0C1NG90_9CYAN|nr:hypothetical protein [Tolypothrix bouteillei]KAF3884684.1 hypothetical protein DA73_0400003750 [Tolypothrix bouteillei VB521301]
MIHHFSISVKDPYHVATVFAEILKGQALSFPPHPGSYIVVAFDGHGTAIEFYPLGTELVPGVEKEQCNFVQTSKTSDYKDVHAALSVSLSQEEIEHIGKREGWRVVRCNRDSLFDVMELWVENRLMIELLTTEMASQYLSHFLQPEEAAYKYFSPVAVG